MCKRHKHWKKIKPFKSWSTVARGLLLLVIGLIILIAQLVAGYFWKDSQSETIRYFVLSITSTFASIFIVSAVWEWLCKVAFAKQIQLNLNISEKIIDSGIKNVIKFRDINWKEELTNVSNFTICVRFGNDWRNYHQDIINSFISSGNQITVVLPDYRNDKILNSLLLIYPKNHQKNNTISDLKKQIENSASDYKNLGVNVLFYPGVINTSFYRLDKTIFYSPYAHDVTETQLPALKIADGILYNFYNDDIEDIIKKSKP